PQIHPLSLHDALPISVRTADGSIFVSPDNGVASQAWDVAGGALEAHVLDDESLWNANAARTFRARDVFSPVAARLADGLPIGAVDRKSTRLNSSHSQI